MTQRSKAAAEPPSFALYNIRFLSLSPTKQQRRQWQRKVANVQTLCRECTIVGLVETHVAPRRAHRFFGQHIQGVATLYVDGMAVFINKGWAEERKPELHTVVPGAIVAVAWKDMDGRSCWLFFFRLDAFKEKVRRQQLAEATRWAHTHVGKRDWTAFAGDRNFTCHASERQSSAKTAWSPSAEMNTAWEKWLDSLAGAEVVQQAEFTWGRIFKTTAEGAGTETEDNNSGHALVDSMSDDQLAVALTEADRSTEQEATRTDDADTGGEWSYAVLDVVGTNQLLGGRQVTHRPVARRGDEVPAPRVSDHWPIELHWYEQNASRRRKKKSKAGDIVRKPIPAWLAKDPTFNESFAKHWRERMSSPWRETTQGLAALSEFNTVVYQFAEDYQKSQLILAQTPAHKLEVCLAMRRLLQARRIGRKEEAKMVRLCKVYPRLSEMVELDVQDDSLGWSTVPAEVDEALMAHCRDLAREATQECVRTETKQHDEEQDVAFKTFADHSRATSKIQELKSLKAGRRLEWHELWDEENKEYTTDEERMADIVRKVAWERQGTRRADERSGLDFLKDWQADFRHCRTSLQIAEIEVIIKESSKDKRPGPDGVLSNFCRRQDGDTGHE